VVRSLPHIRQEWVRFGQSPNSTGGGESLSCMMPAFEAGHMTPETNSGPLCSLPTTFISSIMSSTLAFGGNQGLEILRLDSYFPALSDYELSESTIAKKFRRMERAEEIGETKSRQSFNSRSERPLHPGQRK
jgi:hypothetical protein